MPTLEIYIFSEPLHTGIGEEATISIFKHVLATEGAPHQARVPLKRTIISSPCPVKSSSKNPNFYNSKQNFSPSQGAQMNLLKNKACVFLPYAPGTYRSAGHTGGAQRLPDGTKPMCPSSLSRGSKGRHAPFLLLFSMQMADTW